MRLPSSWCKRASRGMTRTDMVPLQPALPPQLSLDARASSAPRPRSPGLAPHTLVQCQWEGQLWHLHDHRPASWTWWRASRRAALAPTREHGHKCGERVVTWPAAQKSAENTPAAITGRFSRGRAPRIQYSAVIKLPIHRPCKTLENALRGEATFRKATKNCRFCQPLVIA